jgi:molecular chaperone DnaK
MAIVEGGEASIIDNAQGRSTTPSVVSVDENQERLVGKPAKNKAVQNWQNTAQSVKRAMGRQDHVYDLRGTEYTPEQVSAMILRKLKRDAEKALGRDVNKAIITVPAHFSDPQRNATKNAGEIAGLEVERIISEPTAAAMAYGIGHEQSDAIETVMVYDLGGGTFDVSILEVSDQMFDVKVTNGNTNLGGDDWDSRIIDWAMDKFKSDHGVTLNEDRQALQRLTDSAEKAKIELSERPETTLSVPFIISDGNEALDLEYKLTRSKFNELTEDLVEDTAEPVRQSMEEAGLTQEDLDQVLMVGGATRMPAVRKKLKEITGREPHSDVKPDEAVALGAAIQGGILSGQMEDVALVDVTPLSLGIATHGNVFEDIIPRNTTIPTQQTKTFTTAQDEQTYVDIRVFQGERDKVEENVFLGEFRLGPLPPAKAGEPRIDVEFMIDADGILHVSAQDDMTGDKGDITIEGGVGLSDDEVEQMRQEAAQHEEEDQQYRERTELRNQLKDAIRRSERLLDDDSVELPEKVRNGLPQTIGQAESLLEEDDRRAGGVEIEKLKSAYQEFDEVLADVSPEPDDDELPDLTQR